MNISLDEQIKKDKIQNRVTHPKGFQRSKNYVHCSMIKDTSSKKPFLQSMHKINYKERNHNDHHKQQEYNLLKITNLHYSIQKQQLMDAFNKYGKIKSCRIQWDKMGRSNEKATIQYFNEKDAEQALKEMNGTKFQDQPIQIEIIKSHNVPHRHQIYKRQNRRNFGPKPHY